MKKIDKSFFEIINTPNKAYILGLIISDGYVDEKWYKLNFTSKDEELVKIFKRELKSEHKLGEYDIYDKRTNKTYKRYSIQIPSKKIINDLIKLNIRQNKSFTSIYPPIPNDLFWDFFRGLFDGDGSIIQENKLKKGRLRFKIIGSYVLLKETQNKLKEYGLNETKINKTKYKKNDNVIVNLLYYSYHDLKIIQENMYNKSNNLRLTRKYNIFQTLTEFKLGSYDRTKNLKKLKMFDLNSNYIKTFNNIHEACADLNTKYNMIHRVAIGERKQTKGFIFKYI